MTLIIAHRDGWMVADTELTMHQRIRIPSSVTKIRRWREFGDGCRGLSGCAGNSHVCNAIGSMAEPSSTYAHHAVADKFKELKDDGANNALVIEFTAKDVSMYDVDSSGGVDEIDADYWAIGTACEHAMGYLDGIAASGLTVHVCDGINAVKVASTRYLGVGSTVKYAWLQGCETDFGRSAVRRCYRKGCTFCGGPLHVDGTGT